MVGKSAHGNSGKVPYYEHGWATRKQGCLVKQCFDCSPFRRTQSSAGKCIKDKITSLKSQIEVLAERLAMLPKSVSPEPVFRQMEKIEALKNEEETMLQQIEREAGPQERYRPRERKSSMR